MGGTGFHEAAMPAATTSALLNDALHLPDSNRYFRRFGGGNARWNRVMFYDGTILHAGDILEPDRLTNHPFTGRLTVSGFYAGRCHAR